MKNVFLIVLVLLAAIGVFVYLNNPDMFKGSTEVADNSGPQKVDKPKPGTTPKPKPKTTPKAPATATVVAPGQGMTFVNGTAISGEAKVPAGKAVVSRYDQGRFGHEVIELKPGERSEIGGSLSTARAGKVWSTFQGDNLRTGHVDAPDRSTLKPRWSVELGEKVKGSPVVIGNTAFLSSDTTLVMAVDLSAGEVLWREGKTGSDNTPIANDMFVFAGADSGHFRAYHLTKGKVRGEKFLDSYATSLALISDEAFLVTTRSSKVYNIKTKKNFMGKVPLKVNWESDVNELWKGTATPLIFADKAVFHATAEGLVAISLQDGHKLWPSNPGASDKEVVQQEGMAMDGGKMMLNFTEDDFFMMPTPASDGSTIYAVSPDGLQAVSASNGKVLWQRELDSKVTSSISLAYGLLYYGAADGSLNAVSTKDGSQAFSVSVGKGAIFASPVIFADKVLVGNEAGKVMLRNAFSGAEVASSDALVGAPIFSTPAVEGGTMLVINQKGRMACFQ